MSNWLDRARPAWTRDYDTAAFGRDALAGLILSVLLVPQAMAYAQLAGLAPGVGLLTAMIAPLIYAALGRGIAVSMGPVALASLLVAGAVEGSDAEVADAAAIIAIETGLMLVLLSVLRLGRLVNFISEPALLGFTAAAAVLIASSQLSGLAGIDAARSGTVQGAATALWEGGAPHWPTLALGALAVVAFVIAEPLLRRLALLLRLRGTPRLALMKSAGLLVIVAAVLASLGLGEDIARVAPPESRLPSIVLPPVPVDLWVSLLVPSLTVAIVVFVTGIAVSKSLSSRRRQSVDSDGEAMAIGAANLAVGLTGGYAAGVSLSRSALVHDVGARSPLASALAAVIVLPVMLFGGPVLSHMPVAVLSALVISAIFGLIKLSEIRAVMAHSRLEGAVIAATFLATIVFGVQWGLLAGAVAGIAGFLWSSSLPRVTREGPDPEAGDDIYRSVQRDTVEEDTGPILVIRIDRPFYFGNVGHTEDEVSRIVSRHPEARVLILDMRAVTDVDATGLRMLTRLLENIEEKQLTVIFASLQMAVRDALAGQKHVERREHYDTVGAAAEAARKMLEEEDEDASRERASEN